MNLKRANQLSCRIPYGTCSRRFQEREEFHEVKWLRLTIIFAEVEWILLSVMLRVRSCMCLKVPNKLKGEYMGKTTSNMMLFYVHNLEVVVAMDIF